MEIVHISYYRTCLIKIVFWCEWSCNINFHNFDQMKWHICVKVISNGNLSLIESKSKVLSHVWRISALPLCLSICVHIDKDSFLNQYGVCLFSKGFLTHYLELRVLFVHSPTLCYQTWFCYLDKGTFASKYKHDLFEYCVFYSFLSCWRIIFIHIVCTTFNYALLQSHTVIL